MPLDPHEIDKMLGDPWRMDIPPMCPKCGYDLSGTGSNRCPECGTTYVRKVILEQARRTQQLIRALKYANRYAANAQKAVIGGAVLVVVAYLRQSASPVFAEFLRLIAIITAMASLCISLNVFRVRRLPPSAVDLLPEPPSYGTAITTAILAVALIFACLYP